MDKTNKFFLVFLIIFSVSTSVMGYQNHWHKYFFRHHGFTQNSYQSNVYANYIYLNYPLFASDLLLEPRCYCGHCRISYDLASLSEYQCYDCYSWH